MEESLVHRDEQNIWVLGLAVSVKTRGSKL